MSPRLIRAALLSIVIALIAAPLAHAQGRGSRTKVATTPRARAVPQSWWFQPNPRDSSFTFPAFNQTVNDLNNITIKPMTGAPAGPYSHYTVTLDWSAISGDPYSSEAIWALANSTDANTATFHADPGPANNSFADPFPASLSWDGFMDVPYNGGNPLYMYMAQVFDGSTAQWDNVSVTIDDAVITPPPAVNTSVGGSVNTTLAAAQVLWFKFNYSGSGALDLNTMGSNLSDPNASFPNDSEIGLYASNGTLIDTNDDIDFSGGNFLSQLLFADGELLPGDYYLAVGGFNTDFGSAFNVTSTSGMAGDLVVNGIHIDVPEPASLGLMGMALAGLVVRRRRA